MAQPGDFASLVALRLKMGEVMALDALDHADQVRRGQPLLQFDPEGAAPAKQFDRVEAVARKLHGLGRAVMVDASDAAVEAGFRGGPVGALGELADRLGYPADLFDSQGRSTSSRSAR
ncbi:hypothetical protein [Amycolatopsis sp. NPDC051903]|uniref:hypothetical protein n=1 Tax=Amycolatopsis sp. NPDC051903 TaxID=3363936 RepID=UPI0037A07B83